jgi:hypothetical protein
MSVLANALPLCVENITPDWLSAALSVRSPGTVVDAVVVESADWGTATKVFVVADYAAGGNPGGIPSALCLKGCFSPQLRPMVGAICRTEADFYEDIAPILDVAVPRCWFAGVNLAQNQGVVVLDDLRAEGVVFGTPEDPYTPDQVARALGVQAAWHAKTWDVDNSAVPAIAQLGLPSFRNLIYQLLSPEHWNDHITLPAAKALTGPLADSATVTRGLERMWQLDDASTHALSHGDAHVKNTYVDTSGTPHFLDWQSPCRAPYSDDVAMLLVGALSVEQRREHERGLLQGYLDALASRGGPRLDFDEAWLAYRRRHLHGLMFGLIPENMQPLSTTSTYAERYARAVADHDTLSLLGC